MEELERRVVELKESGLTRRQIGEKLGIDRRKVGRILKKLGLTKSYPERLSKSELEKLEPQIVELARAGLINREIARRLRIRVSYVGKTLESQGISKSSIRKHFREEFESKVIELSKEGLSNSEIGRKLGILRQTAHQILKKHGLAKVLTEEYLNRTVEERLLDFLKPNSGEGCWEFQGSRNRNGYGKIVINRKEKLAHRLSYTLFVGDIPRGLCVLHKCDHPKCCNPDHLFLGTHVDNVADRTAKGRNGVHPNKKSTPEIIDMIRRLKLEGQTDKEISNQIGVHRATISFWLRRYR